jgi:hypothetical protein
MVVEKVGARGLPHDGKIELVFIGVSSNTDPTTLDGLLRRHLVLEAKVFRLEHFMGSDYRINNIEARGFRKPSCLV